MFIKKVFKLSSSMKSLAFPSQNALAYHLSHIENLKGAGDAQEHLQDSEDKLTSQLKSAGLSKLIITLQSNKQALQGSHIAVATSNFYHLMKKEASAFTGDQAEQVNIEWKEHPFFKDMLEIIKSNINKLSGSETVQVLYYTNKLKGSSEIHRMLIEHLTKNIKNLSLQDFRLISSLLKKSEKSQYLVDAEKAMMKNLILRVSMNHQKDDIEYLANGLYFLSCNSSMVSRKLLNLFVEDLCNYKNDIPLENALIIHESLCSLTYFPKGWLDLLKKIQESIACNIEALEPVQINFIIFAIAQRVKPNDGIGGLYNGAFIDKLVQRLISDDAGFESTLSALKCLNDMRHYNLEILNYTCASYFEKITLKNEHIKNHSGKLLVILSGLANANYKSVFWNEMENYIMNEQSLLKYHHVTLCVLSLNAICLDCYPTEILKKLFDNKHDFSKDSFSHWTFTKIYQKIKTIPDYKGPLPSEKQIESMKRMFQKALSDKKSFAMLPHLEEGLGGPAYVKTNLGTKLFHIIDHVVAFDKNSLPIPLNAKTNMSKKPQDIEYLEDLDVPAESKIVAVIFTPSSWYFKNTNKLLGQYNVFLDTLEKMGYNVVDVNLITWKQTLNDKRKTFLLSKIKSKLESTITTSNTT